MGITEALFFVGFLMFVVGCIGGGVAFDKERWRLADGLGWIAFIGLLMFVFSGITLIF